MAEGAALEMRCAGNCTEGSNPSRSESRVGNAECGRQNSAFTLPPSAFPYRQSSQSQESADLGGILYDQSREYDADHAHELDQDVEAGA